MEFWSCHLRKLVTFARKSFPGLAGWFNSFNASSCLLLILLFLAGTSHILAVDRSFTLPPGTLIEDPANAPFSLVGDTLAITTITQPPPYSFTRIVQIHGLSGPGPGTVVTTDIPGYVGELRLSPDEQFLVVTSVVAGEEDGPFQTTIVKSNGTVAWSKTMEIVRPSTTGTHLLEIQRGGRIYGKKVWVYDLAGNRIKEMSFESSLAGDPNFSGFLTGVALVGDGSSIIAALRHRVWRLTFGTSPTTIWDNFLNPSCGVEYGELRTFDANRIVVNTSKGGFQIIRISDGVIEYSFDPDLMVGNSVNPSMTKEDWLGYKPYPGPTPNTATLFKQTSSGFTLDISTGTLTPVSVNVTVSPTHVVRKGIYDRRLVILNNYQICIRQL